MKKIISVLLVAVMLAGFAPVISKAEQESVCEHTFLTDDTKKVICISAEEGQNCHYSYCTKCKQWIMQQCSSSKCTKCGDTGVCEVCGQNFTYHKDIEWVEQENEKNCYWHCSSCNKDGAPHSHYYGQKMEYTISGKQVTCGVDCGSVCLTCGHIRSDAPHVWIYQHSDTEHWQECTECGITSAHESHHGGTATCTVKAVCEECGVSYGSLADHVPDGIYHYNEDTHWQNCSVCGTEIESADHTYGDWHRSTMNKQSRECTVCDYSEERDYHVFTVNFDNNGHGTKIKSQSVIWGNCATSPGTLSETGFTFVGWYKDKAGVYEYDFTEPIEKDTTVYAKWKDAEYNINYKEKDGSAFKGNHEEGYPTTHIYGQNTTLKKASEDGYDFVGWYSSPSFKDSELVTVLEANKYTSDISLYAKLTGHSYTVVYNANNSESTETMEPSNHVYGTASRLNKNMFTRVGYSFAGWTENQDGSGDRYDDQDEVKYLTTEKGDTVTLYAQWTPANYGIKYYDEGGEEFTGDLDSIPTTHTYGTDTDLENGYRTGYDFKGWFTDEACTEGNEKVKLGATEYTSDIVLYAKWEARQNRICYWANGTGVSGTMDAQTYISGEAVTLSENKYVRTGHTFLGWSTEESEDNTVVYTDKQSNLKFLSDYPIDLFAVWGKNYKVELKTNSGTIADGKNVAKYTTKTATALPTAADITRTGYDFQGWYESADFSGDAVTVIPTTATGDKTYYAKWTVTSYTVTLYSASTTSTTGTASFTVNGGVATTIPTTGVIYEKLDGSETIVITATPGTSYYAKIYTDKKTLAISSKGTAITYQVPADIIKTNPTIKVAFSTNPYTGDDFDPMLWVIALAAAGAGAAITIVAKKRAHN